jgi:hypothetical protein
MGLGSAVVFSVSEAELLNAVDVGEFGGHVLSHVVEVGLLFSWAEFCLLRKILVLEEGSDALLAAVNVGFVQCVQLLSL